MVVELKKCYSVSEIEYKGKKHRNCVHTFKTPKVEEHRKVTRVAIKWYN